MTPNLTPSNFGSDSATALDATTISYLNTIYPEVEAWPHKDWIRKAFKSFSPTDGGITKIQEWLKAPLLDAKEIVIRQDAAKELAYSDTSRSVEKSLKVLRVLRSSFERPDYYYGWAEKDHYKVQLWRFLCVLPLLFGFSLYLPPLWLAAVLFICGIPIFLAEIRNLRDCRRALRNSGEILVGIKALMRSLRDYRSERLRDISTTLSQAVVAAPAETERLRHSFGIGSQLLFFFLDLFTGYSVYFLERRSQRISRWMAASSEILDSCEDELGAYLISSKLVQDYSFKMPTVMEPEEGRPVFEIQKGTYPLFGLETGVKPYWLLIDASIKSTERGLQIAATFSEPKANAHLSAWLSALLLWAQAGLPVPVSSMSLTPMKLLSLTGEKGFKGSPLFICFHTWKRLQELLSREDDHAAVPKLLFVNSLMGEDTFYEEEALFAALAQEMRGADCRNLLLTGANVDKLVTTPSQIDLADTGSAENEAELSEQEAVQRFVGYYYRHLEAVLTARGSNV